MTQVVTCGGAVCPECGSRVAAHAGFVVCEKCGLAVNREYVPGTFELGSPRHDDSLSPSRNMAPGKQPHLVDDLGSSIGYREKPELRKLTGERRNQFRRLRRRQIYARFDDDALYRALRSLNRVRSRLNLPRSVCNRAAHIISRAREIRTSGMFHHIVVAAIITAIREQKVPVTSKEIFEVCKEQYSKLSEHSVRRGMFWLQDILKIESLPLEPIDYLPRVISALSRNQEVLGRLTSCGLDHDYYFLQLQRLVTKVLTSTSRRQWGCRDTYILTVSCCYSISRLLTRCHVLSQERVADACGVSVFCVRDHHNQVWKPLLDRSLSQKDRKRLMLESHSGDR